MKRWTPQQPPRIGAIFTSIALLITAQFVAAESTVRSFTPLDHTPKDSLTTKGEIVMVALYREMGMEFHPSKKKVVTPVNPEPPTPKPPAPQPAPKPVPKVATEDDFFGSNDDFFNEDAGFEDVVKGFDEEFESTVSTWDKEYKETLARWGIAQKKFKKERHQYENALYDLDKFEHEGDFDSSPLADRTNRTSRPTKPGDYHVLPYAFTQNTQDQASRGTCAAFAAIRSIENLLSQHIVNPVADVIDLSEQQFFNISRADCFEQPCRPIWQNGRAKNDGSLYDYGFRANQKGPFRLASIVTEDQCRYRPIIVDNVTYSPLESYCSTKASSPRFRVARFSPKIPFESIRSELDANRPIAASFYLPANFMSSKGLVSLVDPKTGRGTGPHDGGHAMALIGYIMLPEKFWQKEGRYCAITANSWGEGWGQGGYACMTEKWMKRFYKYSTSISRVNAVKL